MKTRPACGKVGRELWCHSVCVVIADWLVITMCSCYGVIPSVSWSLIGWSSRCAPVRRWRSQDRLTRKIVWNWTAIRHVICNEKQGMKAKISTAVPIERRLIPWRRALFNLRKSDGETRGVVSHLRWSIVQHCYSHGKPQGTTDRAHRPTSLTNHISLSETNNQYTEKYTNESLKLATPNHEYCFHRRTHV